ncbi:hypothetical protein LLG95_05875 [bacterium]|nr:hypothetical protein [bacterium]
MNKPHKQPASPARVAAWKFLCKSEEIAVKDPRERALAEHLVRGMLRRLSLIDALIDRSKLVDPQKTPEPVRWVVRLAAFEKIFQSGAPDYAIGQQAVALARVAGGEPASRFVNFVVRRLLPALPESIEELEADPFVVALPDDARLSIPRPVLDALREGYGASGLDVARALAPAEAPLWLRANTLKTTAAALIEAGLPAAQGLLPEALRWTDEDSQPWKTEPWARGELTVQDLGAMLAARLLEPSPGSRVADLCAAPGGKTGHLWELMGGQGRLVAAEIDPQRRRVLAESLERLYGSRLEEPTYHIEIIGDPAGGDGTVDRVLVDAPCQALGLIARHPEIRWDDRLSHRDPVLRTQRELLETASKWVAPGGRLLWATCSPTKAENEGIVKPWLAGHPDWRLIDPKPILEHLGATDWTQVDDGFIRTRPDKAACDGFAYVLLERAF